MCKSWNLVFFVELGDERNVYFFLHNIFIRDQISKNKMENNLPSTVRVAVRVRPLVTSERQEGCDVVLSVDNQTKQIISNNNTDRTFAFDHTYGISSTQTQIYNSCVRDLEERLFQGFNATLLAYGQTGSGKTYTMGTADDCDELHSSNQGIIPRTIASIFAKIQEEKESNVATHTVQCSFVEIHNEELRDLLSTENSDENSGSDENRRSFSTTSKDSSAAGGGSRTKSAKISIREDSSGKVFVSGLVEKTIEDETSFADVLRRGTAKRATASTSMNSVSSRSHAILTVTLHRSVTSEEHLSFEGAPMETTSQFRLVDLAGSERAKRTQAHGARLREGININKGLLALGNVISVLGGGTKSDKKTCKKLHVPYRDSKLTRMLQSSLGGNSCTVMIACVSPADTNFEESWNTLRYASRARNIKNTPVVNTDTNAAELLRLRTMVSQLQAQLSGTAVLPSMAANDGSSCGVSSSSSSCGNSISSIKTSPGNTHRMHRKISKLELENAALAKQLSIAEKKMNDYRNRVVELESYRGGGASSSSGSGSANGSDGDDKSNDALIVTRQAQTIRELRARVDALESESAAVEVMMQMPSVDELMAEMDRYERVQEKETSSGNRGSSSGSSSGSSGSGGSSKPTHTKSSSSSATDDFEEIISMQEIEEAMMMQRDAEMEEKEHVVRQNALEKEMSDLDTAVSQKEALLKQIRKSDAKLNEAKNQVESLKQRVERLSSERKKMIHDMK